MERFQELQRRSERLLPATSPVYAQASDGSLEAVGTAVFFQHQDRHFVLSAAHVFDTRAARLLIGDDRLIPLDGKFVADRRGDIDLAFAPLNHYERAMLARATFLTRDNVDTSDDPEGRLDGRGYYVVGFRADDNTPSGAPAEVVSRGAAYLAHAVTLDKYAPLGVSRGVHLVLTFDRRTLYSDPTTLETESEPEGLSGSGVWQFRSSAALDKLVAILIEHSNNLKGIIATRVGPLLDALAEYSSRGVA